MFKIGLAGAPLSGKTTLGAMLYTEFMQEGVEGVYLIPEEAKTWLAEGNKIESYRDQFTISNRQKNAEDQIVKKTTFNPVICDSCLWLGKVYLEMNDWGKDHQLYSFLMSDFERYKYDMTIYIPMSNTTGETSEYRVHDGMQSAKIAYLIEQELKTKDSVFYAPVDYAQRDEFVKYIVKTWRERQENQCQKKKAM